MFWEESGATLTYIDLFCPILTRLCLCQIVFGVYALLMVMTKSADVLILTANEYDDTQVSHCLAEMHRAQLTIHIIALRHGLISGFYGTCVRPHTIVAEFNSKGGRLLIIPGTRACVATLLSEPRSHQIVKRFLTNGHYVVALAPYAQTILANTGTIPPTSERFLSPSTEDTLSFIRTLPNYVL